MMLIIRDHASLLGLDVQNNPRIDRNGRRMQADIAEMEIGSLRTITGTEHRLNPIGNRAGSRFV